MGTLICSSPTRRMIKSKCVCPAITLAIVVAVTLLVNFVALSGFYPHTPIITDRFQVFSSSREILRGLPDTISRIQKRATLSIYASRTVNNKADFLDPQFIETVEEEYERLRSSVRWLRQRVDWSENELVKPPEEPDTSQHLTVTILSATPAFSGNESDPARQALLSWLHLSPRPQVILLGRHPSLHKAAKEFPGMVSVEEKIDYSWNGLPMFNSMVARAHAVDTNVTVLIRPDVILLQDFMPGLRKMAGTFNDWVLVSRQLGITELPFKFVHKGGGIVFLEQSKTGESMIDREMASFVSSSGKLEVLEGADIWAWNVGASGSSLLFASSMPPFTYGGGYHDQWMARGLTNGARAVVDATDALVGFHVLQPSPAAPTPNSAAEEWQFLANLYLYRKERNIRAEERELLSGGWKLIACPAPATIKLCVSGARSAALMCHCSGADALDPAHYTETFLERESRSRLEIIARPSIITGPALSHTLDQLLPRVADAHKNVVLVGATSAYADMLLSFVCRAQALGVRNVLVAALDKPVYKAAFLQGLPVFYVPSRPGTNNTDTCDYGSPCFQDTMKLKSQAVLQILRKGFNVLWSDVDVVWFKNPLPHLAGYGPGVLPVQSDEPNMYLPANGPGRVNSGLYYARSEPLVIKTLKEIAKLAKNSNTSDQPSFNRVLCGEWGQHRVSVAECKAPTGLRTVFLDRHVFPNGIVNGYWWHPNLSDICAAKGVYVLHNNWIHGKDGKVRRQKAKQVWYYDDAQRMCAHPWQRTLHQRNHSQPTR